MAARVLRPEAVTYVVSILPLTSMLASLRVSMRIKAGGRLGARGFRLVRSERPEDSVAEVWMEVTIFRAAGSASQMVQYTGGTP